MKPKNLKNVLVCLKNNQLRLTNIRFNEKILEIKHISPNDIKWDDICTKDLWQKFINTQESVEENETSFDGKYMLLIPGGIDPHVHFNTPGFEAREDFEHASMAAAAGGVTTIIDMPCTSIPPVTCKQNFETKLEAIKDDSYIDFALWGGVRGNDYQNGNNPSKYIDEIAESGIAGFKAYLISGMDTFNDLTFEQMLQTAKWVKKTGLPLAVHAEDKTIVTARRDHLHSIGNKDWQAYYFARDETAEAMAVMKMVDVCRQTGCKIHIVHLSSQFGVELIRQAKNEGLNISAETCPHYLYFTRNDFENPEIAAYLKTAPPVKTEYDKIALWQALNDGTLEFVTTDHAGCDPDKEKKGNDFWEIYGGIPGVEHRLPFLFSEGFKLGRMTLEKTIDLLSSNAANYYKLNNKGQLKKGFDADFSLVNLWSEKIVNAKSMHSKGKYTPFEGKEFSTIIEKTFLSGEPIMENVDVNKTKKTGKFIKV